jgi:hypothetical protein
MCISGCNRSQPPQRTVGPGPTDCTTGCPLQRNFIIVYGDPGQGGHNAGRLFQLTANTHSREIQANAFPGNIPAFVAGTDIMTVTHISTVAALVSAVGVGNVLYLAYFGHSGPIGGQNGPGPGALFIGETASPGSNLTIRGNANDRPPTDIPANKFRADAQVRLFGCRGGFGPDPIARQMADQLRIPVYGYTNSGGSLFTTDSTLGHGGRAVRQTDINTPPPANATNVWLIPINGSPTFTRF